MNPESEKLAEYLRTNLEAQAPLAAQEILAWYEGSALVGIWVFAAILLIGLVVLSIGLYHFGPFRKTRIPDEEAFWCISAYIIAALCILLGGTALTVNIHNYLKVKNAPRAVLIEHLKGG